MDITQGVGGDLSYVLEENDYYEKCCGEIYITQKRYLVFHCCLCSGKYGELTEYLKHICEHYVGYAVEDDWWVKQQNGQTEITLYSGREYEEYEVADTDANMGDFVEVDTSEDLEGEEEIDEVLKQIKQENKEDVDDFYEQVFIKDKSQIREKQYKTSNETLHTELWEENDKCTKLFLDENVEYGHGENSYSDITEDFVETNDRDEIEEEEMCVYAKEPTDHQDVESSKKVNSKAKKKPDDKLLAKNTRTKKNYGSMPEGNTPQLTSLKCPICNLNCRRPILLQMHLKTHKDSDVGVTTVTDGEDGRKYKCKICGFAFTDISNCRAHIRRHYSSQKKYKCTYCPKAFHTSTELSTHQRTHTGEKPFMCSQCGKRFTTNGMLNDHMKRHNNLRTRKCPQCDKYFFNNQKVREHMLVHTQERNHICEICNARFARRNALRQHKKIHSNLREYVCYICQQSFNQGPGLRGHLRNKHKICVNPEE